MYNTKASINPLSNVEKSTVPLSLSFLMAHQYLLTLAFLGWLLLPSFASAQTLTESGQEGRFQLSLSYWQGLTYGGQVQVREFENAGTKFDLKKDLGMRSWIVPQGQLSYQLNKRHRLDMGFTLHSLSGSKTLPEDAWYNGTHLQANTKASIDKSRYYRIELGWQYILLQTNQTTIGIRPAMVYDHINFWVDAPVYANTPRNEKYEKFYRQQLPLPNLGFFANQHISKTTALGASISGTYLPRMRTWMQEGGSMYIEQQNLDAKLFISHRLRNTSLTAGYQFRYFSLLEESGEDTNSILLYGSGLTIGIAHSF
jgi:hypothetical protein